MALVEIRDVSKCFQPRRRADRRVRPAHDGHRAGELHRPHGPLGLGQVHAAQPHRRPRQAHERHGAGRRRRGQRDDAGAARGVAGAERRVRVPAVQPAAGAHRVPERRAAAAAHAPLQEGARRAGADRARRRRARRPAATTTRASSPAARSSGSRSPARSSPTRRSSCSTSRPASSTRRARRRSWRSSAAQRRVRQDRSSMVTHDPAGRGAGEAAAPPREGHLRGAGRRRRPGHGGSGPMKFWPLLLANLGRHKRRTVPHHGERGPGALPLRVAADRDHHARPRPSSGSARRLVSTNASGLDLPASGVVRAAARDRSRRREGDLGQLVRRAVRRRQALLRQLRGGREDLPRPVSRDVGAGGPAQAFLQERSGGAHRRAADRPVRLEGGAERDAPRHDLPGRVDLHRPRGLHADRSRCINDDALHVPLRILRRADERDRRTPGGTSCRSTIPRTRPRARKAVDDQFRNSSAPDQDRNRAGVQRQLRHDVGQREVC